MDIYSETKLAIDTTLPFQDYVEAAIVGANRTGGGGGVPLSAAELKRRTEKLSQAMHSLPFLFKFVVKSRLLFAALNGGKGTEPFEAGSEKTRVFKKKPAQWVFWGF
jgi:hypothetical protein